MSYMNVFDFAQKYFFMETEIWEVIVKLCKT